MKDAKKRPPTNLREELFHLPNLLTYGRILVIPLVVYIILEHPTPRGGFYAAALFGLAAITDFLDGWLPDDRATLQRHLQTLTRQGGVGLLTLEVGTPLSGHGTYECVLLPLIHTRDTIDRFLGALARLDTPRPAAMGDRQTVRRLKSAEVIWPDGRPHALITDHSRQTPLSPHVRNARIVRIDRRHFRVYEGGLGKTQASTDASDG